MLLRRFYADRLAQASYMIGCQRSGQAIVVDPGRDPTPYLDAAEAEGMEITLVTETHIHADFMSGSRELAGRCGSELLLSGHGGSEWSYGFVSDDAREIRDGDELELGAVRVQVLHTPGHTPEHICFLVTDGAASDAPLALLSGDFVFVGDVGRPDLLERAAGREGTMKEGARALFQSLARFRELPGHLQLLPGHGAGSACGKALGAVPTSTVGYELLVNWALNCSSEDEFVARVLADQPEPPAYFARMKVLNRDGPPLLPADRRLRRLTSGEITGSISGDDTVIDLRNRWEFASRHLPGTINIPLTKSFVNWSGWLVDPDRSIALIADHEGQVSEATQGLASIGLDDVQGYLLLEDRTDGATLGSTQTIDWPTAELARREEDALLVDVRSLAEWNTGRVPGARRVHLGELTSKTDELPEDRPILLHCKTGHRSAIGTSLLASLGYQDVRNVDGGFDDRVARGLEVVRGI